MLEDNMKFASVIIDQDAKALDRVFEYIIPKEMEIKIGQRVVVPFGNRMLQGFVVDIKNTCEYDVEKLKSINLIIEDYPVIKSEMLELMNFMCEKYHLKLASILRLFLPSHMREGKVKELVVKYVELKKIHENISKNAKKQAKIIEFLEKNGKCLFSEVSNEFGYSPLKALIEKEIVRVFEKEINRKPSFSVEEDKRVNLSNMQQNAVDSINGEGVYLLHGVTGSGKTEVYMHLIDRELKNNKTAIMLVPEISLTPQVLSNFKARFKEDVAILHSGLSAGEKFDEWRRIFFGEAKVVVGARSAIFAPIENVGVIIIDEEHEQSYVSESNPRYATHDVATFRAKYNKCPLVLGSATPSIDSYSKAEKGEYKLIELPVRANGKELPKIQIIDMLMELRNGNNNIFSSQLMVDLYNVVNNKKQAMIFINRRGFSSFQRCRDCGYVAKCTDCDISLVLHKEDNRLKCHYCGKQFRVLDFCPECKSANIKQGAVGTEQVVEELKKLFPDVNVLRMDNDTTSTKNAHQKILTEFKNSKPGILVGTQMIAKGHDFEDVVLVGIVDADQSLYTGDYRSIERTFQLITQVSGRAGRSQSEGKVVLQTYSPRHFVYRFSANYDYLGFYKKEANLRETTLFPPYSLVLRILFSHENENIVSQETKMCYNEIVNLRSEHEKDFIFLDAMKSPLKRIKNKFRYQILMRLRLDNAKEIENKVFNIIDGKNFKSSVFFELNPQNLT